MKKTVISAGVIAVIMSMGSAMASMSPELKVKGEMAVPSCQLSLQNGGVYDLGKISNALISNTTTTSLTGKTSQVMVDCEAETFLSFTVTDNREGTASNPSSTSFGLGTVNGSGKLGYFNLKAVAANVDGTSSQLYTANKGSTTFSGQQGAEVDKNKVIGWALADNIQRSGKKFSTLLTVQPFLASSADMGGAITENVKLDGSATLNFAYGL